MNKEQYETLLLYKYDLEKECLEIEKEYYFRFGDELSALLKLKIEVAILKRKIAYCQKALNQGRVPSESDLEENCPLTFDEYLEYNHLLDETECAKKSMFERKLSLDEINETQRLFRHLVKLTHPDMHPEWQNDPLCLDIYQKSVEAFKCNNLEELRRLYALACLHFKSEENEIEDIEKKCEELNLEIKRILENKPYTYRQILEDQEKIKRLHEAFSKETKEFEFLKEELENRLSTFLFKPGAQA